MASRGQLEIRPRQGIFLGGSDSGDCAALLREGFGALRLVAPSLTSSVCCDCGPAELTVLEGHTATLGRALVEENFLLVWRSLTVFYLEVAKLARNRMVEKLLADICALIPENGNVAGLPRIRRDALQNFFTAPCGAAAGAAFAQFNTDGAARRDSLEELRHFLDASLTGRKSDDSSSREGAANDAEGIFPKRASRPAREE